MNRVAYVNVRRLICGWGVRFHEYELNLDSRILYNLIPLVTVTGYKSSWKKVHIICNQII